MTRSKTKNTFIEPDEFSGDISDLLSEIRRLKHLEKKTRQKSIEIELELRRLRADRELYRRKLINTQQKLKVISGTTPNPVGIVENILTGEKSRAIISLATGQRFICNFDQNIKLNIGDQVRLHQHSMSVLEVLPHAMDPNIAIAELLEHPKETYSDIGGLKEQISEIREVIELSFTNPEAFEYFHIKPPKGVLLYGPPGTGKTLMAKAVANATNAKFLFFAAPELVHKFIGEGARMVREIFKVARENVPVIIFIDEIDAIGAIRTKESQSGEREIYRTLMQLLSEMDGFTENDGIRILAATNRPDILDPAILRPGRFDRIINLPNPNEEGRFDIFNIHMKKMPLYRIDLDELVRESEGLNGAEIRMVCTEAAMFALRDRLSGKNRKRVGQKDFLKAIKKINTRNFSDDFTFNESTELYV